MKETARKLIRLVAAIEERQVCRRRFEQGMRDAGLELSTPEQRLHAALTDAKCPDHFWFTPEGPHIDMAGGVVCKNCGVIMREAELAPDLEERLISVTPEGSEQRAAVEDALRRAEIE